MSLHLKGSGTINMGKTRYVCPSEHPPYRLLSLSCPVMLSQQPQYMPQSSSVVKRKEAINNARSH